MSNWIKYNWNGLVGWIKYNRNNLDRMMNPIPRGKTTFNGDMDSYREEVNANMPERNETVFTDPKGNKVVIPGKPGQDVSAFGIQAHITCLQAENARLNNELDTARTALKNSVYSDRLAREVIEIRDKEIVELKEKMGVLTTINKESDYDCEMKGMVL